jgi:uncharacterized protein YjbI with pentapeptide repeats
VNDTSGPVIRAGALYEGESFTGAVEAVDAGGCRFVDCRWVGLTASGGRAERSSWRGGAFDGVRLTGVSMPRSSWWGLSVDRCAFFGCEAYGSQWRRVRLEGCVIDTLNLREARWRDVRLVDCTLRHLDLGSAQLTDVVMRDCVVERLDLSGVTLSRVDLRGSRLDLARGFDRLRGATVDHAQVLDLAPALAVHLGLTVGEVVGRE